MAHDIFGSRFESRGKSAWHELGNVFDEDEHVTIEDAIGRVADGVTFKKAPIFYFDHEGKKAERIDGKHAVLRLPTYDDDVTRFVGMAGKNWKVRQYEEYAEALESLSDEYPVETAGLLGIGERLFFSLRGPDDAINGPEGYSEEMHNYFVGELNQAPGNAHSVLHTPVRPVCANTLSLGKSLANINIRVPHTGDPSGTIKFVADVVARFRQHAEQSKEIFEAFMGRTLNPDEFAEIVAKTFPRPTKPRKVRMLESLSEEQQAGLMADAKSRMQLESYLSAEKAWEVNIERSDRLREAMRELANQFNEEHPAVANTAWTAYNAATELADWREGREQSIGDSVLFGGRMREKVKAFNACRELVEA